MSLPTGVPLFTQKQYETGHAVRSNEFNWTPIIYFYVIDFALIFLGAVTNVRTTFLGATIFLILLLAWYWRYLLSIKTDPLFFFVIISVCLPIIPMLSYDTKKYIATYQEIIKYYALDFVILMAAALPLTPISRSRKNWVLYLVILLFLLIGLLWAGARGLPDSRVKGFLANPNNFALTAMMLAMLVNEERPRSLVKTISYGIVLFFIYVSKTTGALLGYVGGFIYRYIHKNDRFSFKRFLVLVMAAVLGILVFTAIPPRTLEPVDELIKKIAVTQKHMPDIFSRKQINFYQIEVREKENITSGLWRFFQWHRIVNFYLDSSITQILFGHGIGVTDVYFKLKSHNDYLRFLVETGIVGFIVNIAIWVILYRRMDRRYRWIPVMMAIYCLTENNYDNFPAMSLLVFYMTGAGKTGLAETTA